MDLREVYEAMLDDRCEGCGLFGAVCDCPRGPELKKAMRDGFDGDPAETEEDAKESFDRLLAEVPPPTPWGAPPVLTFEHFEALARDVEPYAGEDPHDAAFWFCSDMINRINGLVRAVRQPARRA